MRRLCGVLLAMSVCAAAFVSAAAQGDVRVAEVQTNAPSASMVQDVGTSAPAATSEADIAFWKRAIKCTRTVSGTAFTLLIFSMLLLTYLDSRHPRRASTRPPVSVVVPCYNDAETIQDTIISVFKAYPAELVDLIVVNDRSTDDSLARITALQDRYSFRIIDNNVNMGKALTLNAVIPQARYDFVLCLDADTLLNRNAIHDMLTRMVTDTRLGAVSSPYRPKNHGFLAAMQGIEYSMLLLTQGAHNLTSAMALWGGCMMVRKTAFEDVGGFMINAITEDVDMAFRMNRRKWRVEQGFRPVHSVVPSTLRGWIKQKIRWTSGGTQCYLRHFRVWIKNPIQIFFILSYGIFLTASVFDFYDGVDLTGSPGKIWNNDLRLIENIANLNAAFGKDLLWRFGSMALCCGLSCVYILPLMRGIRDAAKLLLVVPFSMIYFPMYIIVSFFGTAKGVRSILFPRASDTRGWDTGPSGRKGGAA